MRFAEWWWRRRASRGYGVHSPHAFRLIGTVVRPPRDLRYYGEEQLMLADARPADIRRARLLLRFVAEMQPSLVWTAPGIPAIYTEAIRLAGGVSRIYDGSLFPDDIDKADMVVDYRQNITKPRLKKCLRPGKAFIGFGLSAQMIDKVIGTIDSGVVLEAVESVIALPTTDPSLHLYHVAKF